MSAQVDAVVRAWRDVARGAGFEDDRTLLASLSRHVGLAPDRSFRERAGAYAAPAADVVAAAAAALRGAAARDRPLARALLGWLGAAYAGLWRGGAALRPAPALARLRDARGAGAARAADDDARLLIRALNAQVHRKRLVRGRARPPALAVPRDVARPALAALGDLPPLYRPQLDAFLRRHLADLRARRAGGAGARDAGDDSSDDPPPVYRVAR